MEYIMSLIAAMLIIILIEGALITTAILAVTFHFAFWGLLLIIIPLLVMFMVSVAEGSFFRFFAKRYGDPY